MYARGYLFFVREGSLFAQPFDPAALRLSGTPIKVIDDVEYFQPRGDAAFSVARDGTVVAATDPAPERLTIVDAKGMTIRTIGEAARYGSASVSADGSTVVVGRRDRRVGTYDLWQFGLTRDTAARLSFDPSWENRPALSRDGARLYYASDARGVPDIYVKTVDGSEKDRLLVHEPDEQIPNDVSPDGRYLLYHDAQRGARDLFLLPLGGGAPVPFLRTDADEAYGRISPDGRWVAYTSNISGRYEVYVKPLRVPGAAQQVSTVNADTVRWGGDGRTLYFLGVDDHTIYSAAVGESAGEPSILFRSQAAVSNFEVLPHGRFLLWSVDDDAASPPARVIVRWADTVKEQ